MSQNKPNSTFPYDPHVLLKYIQLQGYPFDRNFKVTVIIQQQLTTAEETVAVAIAVEVAIANMFSHLFR